MKRKIKMIDLHAHTQASDGEKTPEELIDMAIDNGIKALAITDHDSIGSLEKAINYSKGKDITFIPGIELEAEVKKGQMHILGLWINPTNQKLREKLLAIEEGRNKRNKEFIKKFNELGFEITLEELKKVSSGKIIGKPHFAKVFFNKKYITEKEKIFSNYFNKSPFKEIPKFSYSAKEVIEMIKEANGIAILAHPQSLKLTDEELEEKIKELKEYGLEGLECYHSKQTPGEMKKYKKIALKYHLLITKGSDYHGPIIKSNVHLGTGINENIITSEDDTILSELIKRHNQ